MHELMNLNFEGTPVRVITADDGTPRWALADVCAACGIANPYNVAARLGDRQKGLHTVETLGGPQKITVVNEDGLYDVILDSRKPEARRFRKWVTGEVLPSIRKHGAYMTPDTIRQALADPDTLIMLATGANHDHRTFDEFDVSKALRLPYTDDEMALIETATAQAIFDDQGLVNDETLTNMMYGYELDECGNRRMQVKILDDKQDPVVTIDVTDIVATIFNLLNGLLAGRMKTLQDSYDLLHHQGIYAVNDADTTE